MSIITLFFFIKKWTVKVLPPVLHDSPSSLLFLSPTLACEGSHAVTHASHMLDDDDDGDDAHAYSGHFLLHHQSPQLPCDRLSINNHSSNLLLL